MRRNCTVYRETFRLNRSAEYTNDTNKQKQGATRSWKTDLGFTDQYLIQKLFTVTENKRHINTYMLFCLACIILGRVEVRYWTALWWDGRYLVMHSYIPENIFWPLFNGFLTWRTGFPSQWTGNAEFDVFFVVNLHKQFNKHHKVSAIWDVFNGTSLQYYFVDNKATGCLIVKPDNAVKSRDVSTSPKLCTQLCDSRNTSQQLCTQLCDSTS